MKTLRFQGYSDDTFACTGVGIDEDWDNCASGDPVYMRVDANPEALIVTGQYAAGPNAGWMIGVAPADREGSHDEWHIPAWPMRFERSGREYSPCLVVEAPELVTVTVVDAKGRPLVRDDR